jgi:dUTP pyrophosphatase
MAKFEVVNKYKDADIALPVRKTDGSAGYDLAAADNYIIPSVWQMVNEVKGLWNVEDDEYVSLDMMAQFTKETGYRPTLISTGLKCQLEPRTWLNLSVRSSSPLKYWIVLANGIGVIDSDYYNNQDNEGEIFFQVYNLSPFNIQIKKGEIIGQGIIAPFFVTEDDVLMGERTGGFGSTNG